MDVIFKETDCYYLEASSNFAQLPEVGSIVNGQKHIVFGPSTLPVNAWSHLTLTYDGALLRFYVLHCVGLPLVIAVLMAVHFWRVRKDGGISGPL